MLSIESCEPDVVDPKPSSVRRQSLPVQRKEFSDWQYGLAVMATAFAICLAIFTWTWILSRMTTGI